MTGPAARAEVGDTPDFREVYESLRTNLPGISEGELNQAAVAGLLQQMRGRAALADSAAPTNSALQKFIVVERNIAVAGVRRIDAPLKAELTAEFRAVARTNRLKGLVLDLRFATGDDYAAAASLAELFVAKDRELLDWGAGPVKSTAGEVTIDLPVVVLVNQETLGAAEVLAGMLRECGIALILGNPTSGRAYAARELALSGGQKLRIGTVPVKLGDGSEIPTTGLAPDITVAVGLDQERILAAEPFGPVGNSTNAPPARPARSRRPSEADLVRERRELQTNQPSLAAAREAAPDKPAIADPVLARAVDLLKGLAAVRSNRSGRIQD